MGFWDYPGRGISQRSSTMLAGLLKLQAAGKEITDPAAPFYRFRADVSVTRRIA